MDRGRHHRNEWAERATRKLEQQRLYERSRDQLRADAIDPFEYIGIGPGYSRAEVEADVDGASREARGVEENRDRIVLEAIFHREAEMSNWMGESGFTIRTSEYDSLRGVRELVGFRDSSGATYLGLGFSITFDQVDTDYFSQTLDLAYQGRLREVKYGPTKEKSPLKVAAATISLPKSVFYELAEISDEGRKEALENHTAQLWFLRHTLVQYRGIVHALRQRAESLAVSRSDLHQADKLRDLAEYYEYHADLVDSILEDKKERRSVRSDQNDNEQRALFDQLCRNVEKITGYRAPTLQ